MIFQNPAGAPELACDECGCRWFDRMTDTCYQCGAAVSAENLADIRQALEHPAARGEEIAHRVGAERADQPTQGDRAHGDDEPGQWPDGSRRP